MFAKVLKAVLNKAVLSYSYKYAIEGIEGILRVFLHFNHATVCCRLKVMWP